MNLDGQLVALGRYPPPESSEPAKFRRSGRDLTGIGCMMSPITIVTATNSLPNKTSSEGAVRKTLMKFAALGGAATAHDLRGVSR